MSSLSHLVLPLLWVSISYFSWIPSPGTSPSASSTRCALQWSTQYVSQMNSFITSKSPTSIHLLWMAVHVFNIKYSLMPSFLPTASTIRGRDVFTSAGGASFRSPTRNAVASVGSYSYRFSIIHPQLENSCPTFTTCTSDGHRWDLQVSCVDI